MSVANWRWAACSALAVGVGAVLALQAFENAKLRDLVRLRRDDARDLGQAQSERETLRRERVPDAELKNLRADREALGRMKAEIEALKRDAATRSRNSAAPAPVAKPEAPTIDASRNAGRDTPAALLATTLWAAAGGNLDALAETLAIEGNARTKAENLFAAAPDRFRAMTGSPEKMVAWFTKGGLPPGTSIRLREEKQGDEATATLAVVVAFDADADGKKRNIARQLRVQREGGQWKLVVPENALDQYATMLEKQGVK